MIRFLYGLLGLSLFLCAGFVPSDSEARVKVKIKKSFYSITGKNGKALNASMLSGGKENINLYHAVAATETNMDFADLKVHIKDGKCRVKSVNVILDVNYIFPKWRNKNGASKQTKKRWNAFYKELVIHEKEHGEIAVKGAEEYEKVLLGLKTHPANCKNLMKSASFKLNRVIRRTIKNQKSFDKREYAASSKISKLQKHLYDAD